MCFSSKEFREKCYFVLYDENDNLVCYFDNYNELSKYTKNPLYRIVQLFKKSGEFIFIQIENKFYKLYAFVK